MPSTDFQKYDIDAPKFEQMASEYQELRDGLEAATDSQSRLAAVDRWDKLRRRIYDWAALVEIRFHQDTQNVEYKRQKEYCDELKPKLTDLDVAVKRQLLESPYCETVGEHYGQQAIDLWQCDVAAFDPVIQEDLVQQSKLESEYTALLASAQFEFQGETLTLSELAKFSENPDRDIRHDAAKLRSDWFVANRPSLDRIYDDLVKLRHGMAKKLNYEDFIGLGYKLMHRVDYDQSDVETFRNEVQTHVVPLCEELRRQQADRLAVDPLMVWDEALHAPGGNPAPKGDHDWMVDRAIEMFGQMGGGLDQLFESMKDRHLLDLKSRRGKAGGGFCDGLPEFGMPFIFANFNGTKGDVEVFTHEMGHAFQVYSSRHQPLVDYMWPTSEGAEIHSMSLEYLTWPQMELFFGEDAARFRHIHLTGALLFLPYGVAVDHFQHLVYQNPAATAHERAEMWQQMERTYLPWRKYGDLKHQASGRLWQGQLHIYVHPFYYIDYTLALTCALQFWARLADDADAALSSYVALCKRGGALPFQQLADSAELKSPFSVGCLVDVVARARDELERETN